MGLESKFSGLTRFIYAFLLQAKMERRTELIFSVIFIYVCNPAEQPSWGEANNANFKSEVPRHKNKCLRMPLEKIPDTQLLLLKQWFPTGAILPPRGHVAMFRDILDCHT